VVEAAVVVAVHGAHQPDAAHLRGKVVVVVVVVVVVMKGRA